MSVVSVLTLPVRPDAVEELARAFDELDIFGQSARSGGFVGGRFLRPLAEGGSVVVIAEWETPESYEGWLANPARDALRERLAPLLTNEVGAGQLYEEVSMRGQGRT